MIKKYPVLGVSLGLAIASLFATAGCNQGPPLGQVHGRITLDQEPLQGALVTFQPEKGRPAYATTNAKGEYRMQFTSRRSGVLLGPHKVRVSKTKSIPTEDGMSEEIETIPSRYNSPTELSVDIAEGSQEFNFDLVSD